MDAKTRPQIKPTILEKSTLQCDCIHRPLELVLVAGQGENSHTFWDRLGSQKHPLGTFDGPGHVGHHVEKSKNFR